MSSVGTIDGELKVKIHLVGDGGAGKTAFLQRHATGQFVERYTSTDSTRLVEMPPYDAKRAPGKGLSTA